MKGQYLRKKSPLVCVVIGDFYAIIWEEITNGVCGDLVISSKVPPFHINGGDSAEKISPMVCVVI